MEKNLEKETLNERRMSFSEMLKAIEYPYHEYIPRDESYFGDCTASECGVDKCTIPYWFQGNPKALRKALKFVFAYNSYRKDSYKTIRILLDKVIESLIEMLQKEHCVLGNQSVKYCQIIDTINDLMHDDCLDGWLFSFKDEWAQIISENDIKCPDEYIKPCIWNSLSNYQFNENNICLIAEYDIAHGLLDRGDNSTVTEANNGKRYDEIANRVAEMFSNMNSKNKAKVLSFMIELNET